MLVFTGGVIRDSGKGAERTDARGDAGVAGALIADGVARGEGEWIRLVCLAGGGSVAQLKRLTWLFGLTPRA